MSRHFIWLFSIVVCWGVTPLSFADTQPAATIIQQTGKNQWREESTSPWSATYIKQNLNKGNHVKTGRQAKLALVFRDESQLRLNQNSLLVIQDVLDDQGNSTRFKLNNGRAWVKSKNIPNKLIMETPSAVAAIRGTDWDIEVSTSGDTTITVLHGQVHFSNALGEVIVNSNEQAIAKVGQAPYKVIIVNPTDRIQWVSEYQVNPAPFASLAGAKSPDALNLLSQYQDMSIDDYASAINHLSPSTFKTALLADLALYQGNMEKALKHIQLDQTSTSTIELIVLKATAQLMQGNAETLSNPTDAPLITLHNAKIAYFNGQAQSAINLYLHILNQQPNHLEALYGLGRIYTEQENIDLALTYLNQGLSVAPDVAKLHSEKATLHGFYDQFAKAHKALDQAEQYGTNQGILLTGKGILLLKQGKLQDALEAFLQAGVIEPQYARIQLYLGMTYYQLGRYELAVKTLKYASELDNNDPLPYFMLSHIRRETYQPSEALEASLNGVQRLANLKSVNQLANNLSGNTNLASALAAYGLNDWALKLAVDTYDPFWAGNQLFFSHRVNNDRFVQQSELFKGILNDPLVFGGSNTFTDLVEQPQLHGTLRFQRLETDRNGFETTTHSPSLIINGLNKQIIPVALFLEQIGNNIQSENQDDINVSDSRSSPEFTRIGLGAQLTPKLSAFYYSNSGGGVSTNNGVAQGDTFSAPNNTVTVNDLRDSYYGIQYQLSPKSDISLTYFDIDDHNEQNSLVASNIEITQDNFSFTSDSEVTNRFIQNRRIETTQLNWRYQSPSLHFLDIGISQDKNDSDFLLNTISDINSVTILNNEIISEVDEELQTNTDTFDDKDIKQAYFHWQTNQHNNWYTDLFVNYYDISGDLTTITDISSNSSQNESIDDNQLSIGFGVRYKFNDNWLIRQSYRDWTNSGSVVTSGPTLLAGIPFSTRFSLIGTEIQRTALQVEYQNSHSYLQFSLDLQNIDNTRFSDSFVNNTTDILSTNVRQLSAVNNDISTLFESDSRFFADPRFNIIKGSAEIYGFSASTYLSKRLSGNFSYRYFETQQRDLDDNGQSINRRFFTNQARSIARLSTNYSAPFSANIFVNGSYFQYPVTENNLSDGWIWNIGWRQELFKKRVLISVQRLIQKVDQSNSWNLNTEIRF